MSIRSVIFIILFTPTLFCYAQPVAVNTLFEKLKSDQPDTSNVNIYYSISRYYWNINPDSALLMGQKMLDLAEQIGFEKGIALAYLTRGVAFSAQGKQPEALNCHLQALRLSEKLGLEGLTGNNYNNIGIVYINMKNYPLALSYFKKALAIAKKDANNDAPFSQLVNIGEVHKENGEYDSAIAFETQALKISKRKQDELGTAIVLFNIGDILQKQGLHERALSHLQKSLKISQKIKDTEGIACSYNSMAGIYYETKRFHESILTAKTSLRYSQLLGNDELTEASYNILYLSYDSLGDFEKALHYRNLEIAMKDSLHTAEKEKEIKNLQSTYDLEKKQYQIDLLNKDKLIQQEEIVKIKFRRNILAAGIVMLCLLAFILLSSNAVKRRLNKQLKIKNEEILSQNDQLKELNGIKTKLFSIIGHDLRSPINSLQGVVTLMKSSLLSENEIRQLTGRISDDLFRTAELLDNLLFWAKSQMEGMRINKTSFDLHRLIAQNVKLVQSHATDKNLTLKLCGDIPKPLYVYADENLIDIVIRNLLTNAIKFSNTDSMVGLKAIPHGAFIQVTVKDHGLGIPFKNQDKIFNMSASFTTHGTSHEKGSGLGLILCKELVEKNGGSIWFESRPGEGSVFSFTVPTQGSLNVNR